MPARTRTTRRIHPFAPAEDIDTVRWLIREGFQRSMNLDSLAITDYTERHITDPAELDRLLRAEGNDPTVVAANLGAPLTEFQWWVFECHAATDTNLIAWLTAESTWHNQQYTAWLNAETSHAR